MGGPRHGAGYDPVYAGIHCRSRRPAEGSSEICLSLIHIYSGSSLVRAARDRGIRSATSQLLAVIKEERSALERPLEESERRIARLRKTLAESEAAMRDLGVLLSAEQQRLSGVFVERRNAFLKQEQADAHNELTAHVSSLPSLSLIHI